MRGKLPWSTVIAAFLGALVVGALGSGLWDVIFKPTLAWAASIILDAATLGIGSFQDDMYAEMARGTFDRISLSLAILTVIMVVSLAFLSSLAATFLLPRWLRRRLRRINLVSALRNTKRRATRSSPFSIRWIVRLIRVEIVLSVILFGLVAGSVAVMVIREVFIETGALHLDQAQRIVSPYLSAEDRIRLASRIAQIATKNDYDVIDREVKQIANANGLRLPKPFFH